MPLKRQEAGEEIAKDKALIMTGTFYHNPRCSKSRAALELLTERGIEPRVVRYLETPPDAAELAHIVDLLGLEPRDLLRSKEAAYEARALADPALDRDRLIAAMVEEPILIERPIYVKDGRAVIGRPPERVLELL